MKGKLFKSKPLAAKNEILEFYQKKNKPWANNTEKIYTWKTSIPEKWVGLKGEEFFKHSSKITHPKLSIELLQNSKQYMHHFRVQSQETMRKLSPGHSDNKRQDFQKTYKRRLSLTNNNPSPIKSFLIAGESPNAISHQSPSSTIRDSQNSFMFMQGNTHIDEFMKRFDRKPTIREHPIINKGLLGWKLKQLRVGRTVEKKIDYCQIFNVRKNTDNVFDTNRSRRNYSVG
ncbi:hypothetical protein SteCoe_179 [Stentor coeruleus]|uniref:Uncharacterized protein n=1 Tax=Stentor coeruleus TaxID=5963 RepID=A0A1R2D4T0_9CILI|nr:hypothetical protein SteCoe_179 [Stentor coeruleus]